MKKIDNFIFSKGLLSLILAGTISVTLVGCASNEPKENSDGADTPKEQPNDNVISASNEIVDNAASAAKNEYDKVKGDDAVEAAITIMIDGAKKVGNATDEFKKTPEYEKAKEEVKSNFDTLLGFLFNGEEIDGYTIHDVSSTTVEKAKDALSVLDAYIESNIPEYKEKAKEKLKAAGAWLWDKSTDAGAYIMDKGSEWLDDAKEKVKQR